MKRKYVIILTAILIVFGVLIYEIIHAFDPEYDYAEIRQHIGGLLICESVYNADQHDWQYDVTYSYKNKHGKTFKIGSGTYYGREWLKNEQLIIYKNWIILKTGGWIGTDKIIIGDSISHNFKQYQFDPDSLEKTPLWVQAQIHTLTDAMPYEVFVDKIKNGFVEVVYKFRADEDGLIQSVKSKRIVYKIDPETGKLVMFKII